MKIRIVNNNLYILSDAKIKEGDTVLSDPNSYPHWADYPQKCTLTGFDNGDIGISNSLRVSSKAFKKVLFHFKFKNFYGNR